MMDAHENQAAGSIRRLDKPYDGRIRQSAALLAAALLAGMVAPAGGADAPSTFTNPLLSSGPDPWITQVDGVYYYTHTLGDRLMLWRTANIADLAKEIGRASCRERVRQYV